MAGFSFIAKTNLASVSATSVNLSALNVSAGQLVIVFVATSYKVDPATVTDTAGNTYTDAGFAADYGSTFVDRLYYSFTTAGNASNVITVSIGGAATNIRAQGLQYSYTAGYTPSYVSAQSHKIELAAATSSSLTSNSITPPSADAMIFSFLHLNPGRVTTGPAGYAVREGANGSTATNYNITDDATVTATPQTHTYTWPSASTGRQFIALTFDLTATSTTHNASGTVQGKFTPSGAPVATRPISGTVRGSFSLSGALSRPPKDIAGGPSASFSLAGGLTRDAKAVSGTVRGSFVLAGAVSKLMPALAGVVRASFGGGGDPRKGPLPGRPRAWRNWNTSR